MSPYSKPAPRDTNVDVCIVKEGSIAEIEDPSTLPFRKPSDEEKWRAEGYIVLRKVITQKIVGWRDYTPAEIQAIKAKGKVDTKYYHKRVTSVAGQVAIKEKVEPYTLYMAIDSLKITRKKNGKEETLLINGDMLIWRKPGKQTLLTKK